MWNLALELVGDNMFPQHCSIGFTSAWGQILWMAVMFIYLIILWEPYSPSVENQPLSPSLRRTRLPGHKLNMLTNTGGLTLIHVSGGVSAQLSLARNSLSPLCSPVCLLLMVQPQLCQCTDTFLLWVWEHHHKKERNKWGGRDSLDSPLTDYLLLFLPMNEETEKAASPLLITEMLLTQQHWCFSHIKTYYTYYNLPGQTTH